MANKSIIKNIFYYGIGDFIVTAVSGFLLIPLYTRFLTKAEFGELSVLNTATTIFTYFIQFGLISGFSRMYFLYKDDASKAYFNNIITFQLIYSIFLSAILWIFDGPIKSMIAPSVSSDLLFVASYGTAFLSFLPALYSIRYRLLQDARKFVTIQLINSAILVAYIVVGLVVMKMSLKAVVMATLLTNLTMTLYFIVTGGYSPTINKEQLKQTFKIAIPVFIGYFAFFLINKLSVILLQQHVSLEELGVFSLAQQLGAIPTLLSVAIGKAIQPVIFSADESGIVKIFGKYDVAYKKVMMWICVMLILFSVQLITITASSQYLKSVNVFTIIIIANYFYTSVLMQNTLLQYKIKPRLILYCTLAGSIASVLCNYWLIPIWGVTGAALSILIAFVIMSSLSEYFSGRIIRSPKDSIYYLYVILSVAAVFLFVKFGEDVGSIVSMSISMSFCVITFVAMITDFRRIFVK